jgi:O-antigen/teichoic acid export membrane protein
LFRYISVKIISLLWLGSIFGAGCAFVTQVLLARELGPAAFGVFATVLSLVTMTAPLASFGVGGFWLKAFGHEGWQAMRWLRGSFLFTAATTGTVLIVLFGWAVLGAHDDTTRGLLIVISGHLLGQVAVELISAKLQLEERYVGLAFWQALPHLLRLLLVAMLALTLGDLMHVYSVAYIYLLVSVGIFTIGLIYMWRMHRGQLSLKGHGDASLRPARSAHPSLWQVSAQSWPFGLAGLFYLIYFQSDIILLKYLISDEAAGIYNVAFVIMVAVYMLPNVIYQKFLLPKIHRWANQDRAQFYRVYRAGNLAMLLLGILAMLMIWLLAPLGVALLFGPDYQESISIVLILAVAAPARFLASSVGSVLSVQRHIINKIYIMAVAAVVNVGLNLYLIPIYSAKGAAVSTVATELLLFAMLHNYARRRIFIS